MKLILHHAAEADSTETYNITLDGQTLSHPAARSLDVTLHAETVNITRTGSFSEYNETLTTPTLLWLDASTAHAFAIPQDQTLVLFCYFFGAWLFSRVLR